ncbi:MAG: arginase [Bryobacteraceae bacterium]|nr:arginase [Bryobacteraceae bacterium]
MTKAVGIIGVPQDYGAGRRGVDMGPSAVRVANLNARLAALGCRVEDYGNIAVEQPESFANGPAEARHLPKIADNCRRLARLVEKAAAAGQTPLVLGGDHSIAAGTVAGIAKHYRKKKQRIGVVWIDAHGDFNTPQSSPSGNVHGMPLAAIVGMGARELTHLAGFSPMVEPENVALVGIRDIDAGEAANIKRAGVHAFTMSEIDARGLPAVMRDAIRLAMHGTAGVHVSFDMDALDPEEAPGVGTPVQGGITYREAHLAMELLHETQAITSLEVVEVNPVLDVSNKTAQLAVELVLSAMGKKIL